jgi:hypothetical protein
MKTWRQGNGQGVTGRYLGNEIRVIPIVETAEHIGWRTLLVPCKWPWLRYVTPALLFPQAVRANDSARHNHDPCNVRVGPTCGGAILPQSPRLFYSARSLFSSPLMKRYNDGACIQLAIQHTCSPPFTRTASLHCNKATLLQPSSRHPGSFCSVLF